MILCYIDNDIDGLKRKRIRTYASEHDPQKIKDTLETLCVATFFGKQTPLQINVLSVFYFSV